VIPMQQGVVAAGHDLTAEAGAAVLRDGGNAVDAAIAAIAMACVCEPVLCSPGGGMFAMVRDGADGTVRLLDAFVHTPRRRAVTLDDGEHVVHADFGPARQAFRIGPATSATPGLFDGLAALLDRFGTVPMTALVAGAADAAQRGITVTPFQHHLSTVVEPILTATPGTRRLFAPKGSLLAVGDTFRNPGLADALDLIARHGLGASAVGDAVLAHQAGRGHLTRDDLDRYEFAWRQPITVQLGNGRIHINPLPAAGGVLIGHTLRQLDTGSATELAGALAETALARRAADGDLTALLDRPIRPRGTTHVSVVDADGTACSITASNGEGNGELVDGFGFMLNNILGEDDVNPHASAWPPDTRLSSMMCPTIVEHADGSVTALGSGGSSRIRSAISRVVAALCLDAAGLDDAVRTPRLHAELSDRGDVRLDVEPGLDGATIERLASSFPDHRWWPTTDLYFGGAHAARLRADGSMVGTGDPRRSGASILVER